MNNLDVKIKPIIFDDFINPSNVLSIENEIQSNTADNYVLKAPKKGKIYRGSNYNAYKRTNLGSIPRKTEKILLDAINVPKEARGFSSQTSRFSNKQENIKYAYPGPGTYKLEKTFDHTVKDNSYYSSKGFGNGFASNTSRFDDYKEFQDKFAPGPSSYKSDESTCLTANLNKTLSYKSLYNTGGTKTMKTQSDNPGPGHYNPIKANKVSEFEGENHYFKSEDIRFKKVPKSALGPGKYFNEEMDLNLIKNPNKGRTYINTGGKIDMNGNKTQSYFFRNPEEKKTNVMEKFIKTKDDVSTRPTTTPGPADYDVQRDNMSNINFYPKERKESVYFENIRQNKIKKRMQTAGNKIPKPLIDMNLNAMNIKDKEKNNKMNKTAQRNMFVTTQIDANFDNGVNNNLKPENKKKFPEYLIKRNIPGPAYYKPQNKPIKVNFNWNLEKNWI